YPELSGHVVDSLVEDTQGTVWAGTIAVPTARLCAIQGTVQCVGQDGRFGVGVFSLYEDRGSLWVGAATGLWRWTPGSPTRYTLPASTRAPASAEISALIRVNDGPLLVAATGGVKQFVEGAFAAYPLPAFDGPFDPQH